MDDLVGKQFKKSRFLLLIQQLVPVSMQSALSLYWLIAKC